MRSTAMLLCASLLFAAACGRPGDEDAARGLELGRAGDLAAAVTAFERALELDPDHPKALYNLGLARSALAKSLCAERAFGRFVAGRPNDVLGRLEHGRALAALGRYDEALAELREAVRLGLSDHEALEAPEFQPLRSQLEFVMLDVTVAQRAGSLPLSSRTAPVEGKIETPRTRIVLPGSQDEFCDPAGASTLEPADPVSR